MIQLPSEIWLKIFQHLYAPMISRFMGLNARFLELCYDSCYNHTKVYLGSLHDLQDFRYCLENNLVGPNIEVLIIDNIINEFELDLKSIASSLHIVNLVVHDSKWRLLTDIFCQHLVIYKMTHDLSYLSDISVLEHITGTIEINCYISCELIHRLLPKLRNTWTIYDSIHGKVSINGNVSIYIILPFRVWRGSTEVTDSLMIQIEAHLGAKPIRSLYIFRLDPIMCWQHDDYDVSPMMRHIYVAYEFVGVYPYLQSIAIYSLGSVLMFSTDLSKSNMSKVSAIFVSQAKSEEIQQVTQMYPLVKSIYRILPNRTIRCLLSSSPN